MKRILLAFRPLAIIILVLWGIWFVFSRIQASRQEYLAFSERRAAWHERCDVYRTHPSDAPAAKLCEQELRELTEYARQKGWN